jgi:hypothetical protein
VHDGAVYAGQVSFHRGNDWTELAVLDRSIEQSTSNEGELIAVGQLSGAFQRSGILRRDLVAPSYRQESFGETRSRYFPKLPAAEVETFEYPKPLSPLFWALYGEPVADFVRAAQAVKYVVETLGQGFKWNSDISGQNDRALDAIRVLRLLISPTVAYPTISGDGRIIEELAAPTLLASLSLMALQDICGIGRIAICEKCGRRFPTNSKGYACSARCRWALQKRKRRAR